MGDERHLIFDMPQDELVVPSSSQIAPSRTLIPRSSPQRRSRHREVEDEVPIVRHAQQQRDQPQPVHDFSLGGSSTEVKAITFLLITITCVLLFGSMIMTDLNSRTSDTNIPASNQTDGELLEDDTTLTVTLNGRGMVRDAGGQSHLPRRHGGSTRKSRRSLQSLLRGSKCSTKACLEQGIKAVEDTEPSIKPCDDFYQHVCFRWQQLQPASRREDRVSIDYILLDLFSELFVSVLKSDKVPLPELRFFYDECVQPQPNLFRNVRETLLRHLDLKGWPYTDDSMIPDVDLNAKVASLFSEVGLETFFRLRRGPRGILIEQPNNLVLRHFIESEPHMVSRWLDSAYEMLLEESPKTSAVSKASATNVTVMELQLRRILEPQSSVFEPGRLKNCTVRRMADLPRVGYFDLHKFLQVATGGKAGVSESSSVYLPSPKYLEKLRSFPATKHDILNYVTFRVLLELAPLQSNASVRSDMASIAYSFYPEFAGKLTPLQMCLRFLERYDPILPAYLTFQRGLELLGGPSAVKGVLDTLKTSFFGDLASVNGFSAGFKRYVAARLQDVTWEALTPDWLLDSKAREAYADGVYVNNPRHPVPHYFYFWLRTLALKRRQFLLGNPPSWTGGFLTTTVTLAPPYRQLEIPLPVFDFLMSNDSSVGFLHLPRVGPRVYRELYRFMYHEAFNYAQEHEVAADVRYLANLRRCLEKQYRDMDFNPSRAPLNSAKTSVSDTLDFLAVRGAFAAYVRKLSTHEGDYRLASAPNVSGQKLFFIYYARSLCEKVNPRFLVKLMTHGPVSPAWFRVNGPLRNMREFADAFSCPPGSPMNPAQKCT